MEASDFNIRLPPRKRLLAGLRSMRSVGDLELPFPLPSGELGSRLRSLISSGASSHEEIIGTAASAALVAAEDAAAARAVMEEKAATAAKARAAARRALELFDTVSRNSILPQGGSKGRMKLRKKHVPIKLLYKTNRFVSSDGSDDEANSPTGSDSSSEDEPFRKWPRTVDTSTRVLRNRQDKPGKAEQSSAQDLDFSEAADSEFNELPNKMHCSEAASDEEEDCNYNPTKHRLGVRAAKCPSNRSTSMKITSVWKCKKLKSSLSRSDNKMLEAKYSSIPVTESSTSVNGDE